MKANSNIPWAAFEQRRNLLQSLLREKRIVLLNPDMRKASAELRSLYPSIAEVRKEIAVLKRVIARQKDVGDDDDGDERRSRVEYRFAPTKSASSFAPAEPTTSDVLKLRGFAVLWNDLSSDLGGFREKFTRSAFNDSLRDDEQLFLIEHLPPALASTATGDLDLESNSDGLHFEARLDKRDRIVKIAEPLLRARRSMSFAFIASKDRWAEVRGQVIRTVLQAKLLEVSAVKAPAYSQTSLAVAERSNWRAQAAARERRLREIAFHIVPAR